MIEHKRVRIENIINHGPDLKTYVFDHNFSPIPGQFGSILLTGIDEKPFSFSGSNEMTVARRGPFTDELLKKKEGEKLLVRGPYGRGNFPEGKYTIFGGGVGVAPLKILTETKNYSVELAVLAGRTADTIPFLEYFEEQGAVVFTEDGSRGTKGIITDFDFSTKPQTKYGVCGPELMIKTVADTLDSPEDTYVSLERRMKCMRGICGACLVSGYSVCQDGPVFPYTRILDAPHFGKVGRDRTGELVPLKRI